VSAVGPTGRVLGVDMTPAMLARARDGAAKLGLGTVAFREGFIEALPVEDASIDAPPEGVATGETYSASVRARRPALRPADAGDLPAVAALLAGEGLPTAGIASDATRLYLLDGEAVGAGSGLAAVVGFELYGGYALLRSLAVRSGLRGRGFGEALLRHALREAAKAGARIAYGLTTTIPELLLRWGLEEVDRAALPAELAASAELRGACPSSARAFRTTLGAPPR
jgi:amino-acid N-acetyltransferase